MKSILHEYLSDIENTAKDLYESRLELMSSYIQQAGIEYMFKPIQWDKLDDKYKELYRIEAKRVSNIHKII